MKESINVIKVTGNLCIDRAAEIRKQLCEEIDRTNELLVDLSGVDRIDLAGIQILYAAGRSCIARQKPFRLIGTVNAEVCETIAGAGFSAAGASDWQALAGSLHDFGGDEGGAL